MMRRIETATESGLEEPLESVRGDQEQYQVTRLFYSNAAHGSGRLHFQMHFGFQ